MRRSIAIMAVLTLAAGACGDDDGGDGGGPTGEEAAGEEASAACDAWVAATQAIDIDEDLEAGILALEDFVAAAPDDVASAVEPVIPLLQDDPEVALESDEAVAAANAADEWSLGNCGDVRLDVEAVNFAFAGIPPEIEAGRVVFNLTNQTQTDEFHEALLLRKDDGVTETAHDTLAAGLGGPLSVDTALAALEPFELVGGALVEPDGGDSQDAFVVDLEPGEYIVVCLLHADSPELIEAYFAGEEVEGIRHFDHGMFAELTVS